MSGPITRRNLLRGGLLAAPALALGYGAYSHGASWKTKFLHSGEALSHFAHRHIGRTALAREYEPHQRSPVFRMNGSTHPADPVYQAHLASGFADWRLAVVGQVERPARVSLAQLKAMPSRSQITRHDCVEGWSAIGEWTGVPLAHVLDLAGLKPNARYVVFWCADAPGGLRYYESIDMIDAYHPQTILAYGMNGAALPEGHGAPLRLRVERQLGYKHAKFIMRIAVVDSLKHVGFGNGGFWEDLAGYEWFAGI